MNFDPYPIFLALEQRPVLLVGAGKVALRKARGLLAAGAKLTVLAPQRAASLWSPLPPHEFLPQPYHSALLDRSPRWHLIFAATNLPLVNIQVMADARAAGILCSRSDEPDSSDFSNGATLQKPGLTLALSTQGASPALAARWRDHLEAQLDPILLQLSELLARWRPEVLATLTIPAARRALLLRLASAEMESLLRTHGPAAAHATFQEWLHAAQFATPSSPSGADDEA